MRSHVQLLARVLLLLTLLAPGFARAARADEVSDLIAKAKQLYDSGQLSPAASELELALTKIRKTQAGKMESVLPAPLPGWKADESESAAAGAMLLGGGINASRHYFQDGGEGTMDVSVMAESPMLSMFLGMMQNPSLMAMNKGTDVITIRGQKAMVESGEDSKKITMAVANRVLVTVEGYGTDLDTVKKYAEGVKIEQIEAQLK